MTKKILILTLACVAVTGCVPHFKELDSYNTNFRNDEIQTMPGKGDPYTFGGIAEGSGGTYSRQSYATDNQATDARDETASMGEIAKDRSRTSGSLPGVTGSLPGAVNSPAVNDGSGETTPQVYIIDNAKGKELKPGDPGYQEAHDAFTKGNPGGSGRIPANPKSKTQNPKSGGAASGG